MTLLHITPILSLIILLLLKTKLDKIHLVFLITLTIQATLTYLDTPKHLLILLTSTIIAEITHFTLIALKGTTIHPKNYALILFISLYPWQHSTQQNITLLILTPILILTAIGLAKTEQIRKKLTHTTQKYNTPQLTTAILTTLLLTPIITFLINNIHNLNH